MNRAPDRPHRKVSVLAGLRKSRFSIAFGAVFLNLSLLNSLGIEELRNLFVSLSDLICMGLDSQCRPRGLLLGNFNGTTFTGAQDVASDAQLNSECTPVVRPRSLNQDIFRHRTAFGLKPFLEG